MKKLSIITINFNNRDGLRKTIESVVNQTWQDFEYIIIDGGSTDGSVEVIKEFADRIDYWISEPDKGIYNALNKGVAAAKGEYCNFMNSGDCFYAPDTLEKVFDSAPTADIVCGNTYSDHFFSSPDEITFDFLFNASICHQCAFIRTTMMQKYGYDEHYKIVADRKFFVQAFLLENCSYTHINQTIVKYDISGLSSTNPTLARFEHSCMLEELVPLRILQDYGVAKNGALYRCSIYDKLFIEIRARNYSKLVYTATTILLRLIALFKKSAKFIRLYPITFKNESNL